MEQILVRMGTRGVVETWRQTVKVVWERSRGRSSIARMAHGKQEIAYPARGGVQRGRRLLIIRLDDIVVVDLITRPPVVLKVHRCKP